MKYNLFSSIYKTAVRPFFFKLDPELIHDFITVFGNFLGKFSLTRAITKVLFHFEDKRLKQKILGINFENPIGLSAGFDKDAKLLGILPSVGFGYEEIGTVTHSPYKGNPKPRLYRLKKSKGLVVYYGLKNIGAEKIVKKLKNKKFAFPVAISIGKTNSKETSSDKAGIEDYYNCFRQFVKNKIGDFYVVNISCPNTFGGEPFTTEKRLDALLSRLKTIKTNKPIFIKMPINHSWSEFNSLLKVATKHKVDGVIIGNLNKDRKDKAIQDNIPNSIKGGISGLPTQKLSNDLIYKTYKTYGDKFVIIGVGGVFSAEDAYEKIKRGASLVSLITGMIYEGPQLIGQINKDIVKLLEKDGYKNISEAIGSHQ